MGGEGLGMALLTPEETSWVLRSENPKAKAVRDFYVMCERRPGDTVAAALLESAARDAKDEYCRTNRQKRSEGR